MVQSLQWFCRLPVFRVNIVQVLFTVHLLTTTLQRQLLFVSPLTRNLQSMAQTPLLWILVCKLHHRLNISNSAICKGHHWMSQMGQATWIMPWLLVVDNINNLIHTTQPVPEGCYIYHRGLKPEVIISTDLPECNIWLRLWRCGSQFPCMK